MFWVDGGGERASIFFRTRAGIFEQNYNVIVAHNAHFLSFVSIAANKLMFDERWINEDVPVLVVLTSVLRW